MIADNVDVALRVINNPQENIARRIANIDFVYVASTAYLERYGVPKTMFDLSAHRGIHPEYTKIDSRLPKTHSSSSTTMLAEMVKSGMGIGQLPEWLIEDAVHDGSLQLLLNEEIRTISLYAAYMDRAFLNQKIRLFLDFISDKLS